MEKSQAEDKAGFRLPVVAGETGVESAAAVEAAVVLRTVAEECGADQVPGYEC
jgi:hypothetical protein